MRNARKAGRRAGVSDENVTRVLGGIDSIIHDYTNVSICKFDDVANQFYDCGNEGTHTLAGAGDFRRKRDLATFGGFVSPQSSPGQPNDRIGDKMINPIISHSNQIDNTKPDQWRVHLADWFNVRAFRLRRQAASVADPVERRRLLAPSRKMAAAARRAGGSR